MRRIKQKENLKRRSRQSKCVRQYLNSPTVDSNFCVKIFDSSFHLNRKNTSYGKSSKNLREEAAKPLLKYFQGAEKSQQITLTYCSFTDFMRIPLPFNSRIKNMHLLISNSLLCSQHFSKLFNRFPTKVFRSSDTAFKIFSLNFKFLLQRGYLRTQKNCVCKNTDSNHIHVCSQEKFIFALFFVSI